MPKYASLGVCGRVRMCVNMMYASADVRVSVCASVCSPRMPGCKCSLVTQLKVPTNLNDFLSLIPEVIVSLLSPVQKRVDLGARLHNQRIKRKKCFHG